MQDGAVQCVAGNNCIRAAVEGVPRQRVADIGTETSPITGGDGNTEYLMCLEKR